MESRTSRESEIIHNFGLWKDLTGYTITIEKLAGGVTNFACRVDLTRSDGDLSEKTSYIYKGITPAEQTDRNQEAQVIRNLSALGLTAKLYYCAPDNSFRIEEFIPGSVVTTAMMWEPDCVIMCMYALAWLHSVDPKLTCLTATFQQEYFESGKLMPFVMDIFAKAEQFFPEDELPMVREMEQLFQKEELEFLNEQEKIIKNHPVVFSHNDFCYGNMIVDSRTDKIVLIDWETVAPNYRCFDIGAMFNKRYFCYADNGKGFVYYGRSSIEWPEIIEAFECYLIFERAIKKGHPVDHPKLLRNEAFRKELIVRLFSTPEELKLEVDKLIAEYGYCSLLMNHNLIAWAISMTENRAEDFSYVWFGYEKYREYLFFKRTFFGDKLKQTSD